MERVVTRVAAPPKLPVKQRVAAYARVSSGKDAMLHSLSAQVSYYSGMGVCGRVCGRSENGDKG